METVKRVEYFDAMPDDIVFDLIFSLQTQVYDKETTILAEHALIDSIFFIEEGSVEVSTKFEGNNFVIDTLHPGSAINYRAVLMRDQMYVNFKAKTEVKLLTITLENLMALVSKHSEYHGRDKTDFEKKKRE